MLSVHLWNKYTPVIFAHTHQGVLDNFVWMPEVEKHCLILHGQGVSKLLLLSQAINKHKAQLIFTSHDLSTMNNDVFRRDEIWFVAKGNAQNSQLYSLVEFKDAKGSSVRNDEKYDKRYLEGRYGADRDRTLSGGNYASNRYGRRLYKEE